MLSLALRDRWDNADNKDTIIPSHHNTFYPQKVINTAASKSLKAPATVTERLAVVVHTGTSLLHVADNGGGSDMCGSLA